MLRFVILAASAAVAASILPPSQDHAAEYARPAGSGKPNLVTGRDGRVILTWLEPAGGDRHALRFAVRTGRTWTAPRTIRESDRFFVNWADFPSLVETGSGMWVVHWLEKTEAKPYAYHVMLSVSHDAGGTWSDPFPAHTDRSPTEHGFVSMVPAPGGGADILWLDGRNMQGEMGGPMTVRTAALDSRGRLGPEIELDDRACECCQATMARTPAGLIAAWRDRSETEVRDIAVVREVNGRWTAPTVVAADGWEHRACPVNGPSLATEGTRVTLAWYTGVRNEHRVYAVQSRDGGATFGPRVRLDEGRTLGRVHATDIGGGAVAVAWLETTGEHEAEWRVRRIDADGRPGPSRAVVTVSRARLAGFPRLAWTGRDLLLALTATGEDGGVRVVRVAALPPARR